MKIYLILFLFIILTLINNENATHFDNINSSTRQRLLPNKGESEKTKLEMEMNMGWEPMSAPRKQQRKRIEV
jgi:hypothetical protein